MSRPVPWTIDFSSPSLDDQLCVRCAHLIDRHHDAPTLGCAAHSGLGVGDVCLCPLTRYEAKFLRVRVRSMSADGSIQVAKMTSMSHYIRHQFVDPPPEHLKWFVRPTPRAPLFILFATHADAINFAFEFARNWPAKMFRRDA
jgi:hypothetical protein